MINFIFELLLLKLLLFDNSHALEEGVALMKIGSPGRPCPNQEVVFECRTITPVSSLIWRLPSGVTLPDFTGGSPIGAVRMSNDSIYTANLTEKVNDENRNSDNFYFTSNLLIMRPSNNSIITCFGVGEDIKNTSTTVVLSGAPNPPSNVTFTHMEVSVAIEWSRPFYTGEVSLMGYAITANGQTVAFYDTNAAVRYVSPYVIYGDASISAVNSCGQLSQPTSINIPSAPRNLSQLHITLHCDYALSHGRPVVINWVYGEEEEGVRYPGVRIVSVGLQPGNTAGSQSNATTFSTNITEDHNYTITITQTNDIGSTTDEYNFDSKPLIVETDSANGLLTITLTIRESCSISANSKLTVIITNNFHVGSEVSEREVLAVKNVATGKTYLFQVDKSHAPETAGDNYQYNASLISHNGKLLDVVSGVWPKDTNRRTVTHSGAQLSAAGAAGIAIVITIFVFLPIGFVLGIGVMWCWMKRPVVYRGKKPRGETVIYEEPDLKQNAITLSKNEAYGRCSQRRT